MDARINDFLMWCGQRAVQVTEGFTRVLHLQEVAGRCSCPPKSGATVQSPAIAQAVIGGVDDVKIVTAGATDFVVKKFMAIGMQVSVKKSAVIADRLKLAKDIA